jgi:hypothetical protein
LSHGPTRSVALEYAARALECVEQSIELPFRQEDREINVLGHARHAMGCKRQRIANGMGDTGVL